LIAKEMGKIPFRSLGIQPAKDVSDALRAADCLLSPFIDGVSTRRTSAIAALNNGIPVATTARHWTDDWFTKASSEVVLARAFADKDEFAAKVARWLRPLEPSQSEAVQRAHDRFFSWPRIAAGICESIFRS
jgi:glycosyltransferase involved in cell wall biosynthesis